MSVSKHEVKPEREHVVERVDTAAGFRALEPHWNRLLPPSEFGRVFRSFEWLYGWWELFGDDHKLYILTVRSAGEIVGIAPLMLTEYRTFGIRHRIIRFIGTPNCDYCDFLGDDKKQIFEQIMVYLHSHSEDWTKIELSQISEKSDTTRVMPRSSEPWRRCIFEAVETCMAYVFEENGHDRGSFKLARSRNFRNALHFFDRLDGLALEIYRDSETIKAHLPGFFHTHITRWRELPIPSKFVDLRQRRFYELLADRLAPLGLINLIILKHGKKPLGYLFTYTGERVLHLYTVCHQGFYERKSPGIILFQFTCEEYIRSGYDEIDFSRGGGFHKTRFINRTSRNFALTVYRRAIPYHLSALYRRIKGSKMMREATVIRIRKRLKSLVLSLVRRGSDSETPGGTIGGIAGKIGRWVIDYKEIKISRNRGLVRARVEESKDFTVQHLSAEDMETISDFLGFEEKSAVHNRFADWFDRGGICFLARLKESAAALLWAIPGGRVQISSNLAVNLNENEVLLTDESVSPVFEKTEAGVLLWTHVVEYFAKTGVMMVAVCPRKRKDRFAHLKNLGFEEDNRLRTLRVFGLKLY